MTIAVCYFCGATKFGSFNECGSCHKTPTTDEQAAWSLVCSDHHFTVDTLNQISSDMRASGVRPRLDPETLVKVLPAVQSAMKMIRPSPGAAGARKHQALGPRVAAGPTATAPPPANPPPATVAGEQVETFLRNLTRGIAAADPRAPRATSLAQGSDADADRHRKIKEILSGAGERPSKSDPVPLQTVLAEIRESLSGADSTNEVPKSDPPPSTLAQIGRRTVGCFGLLVFGALVVASLIAWFVSRVGPDGTIFDGWGRQVYEAPLWLRLAGVDHWRGLGWWLFDGAAFWITFGVGFMLVSFGVSPRRNGRKQGG